MDGNDSLKNLYSQLIGTPLKSVLDNDFKDANDFSSYYSDSNNLNKLYDQLAQTPLNEILSKDFKDKNDFVSYYVKKKVGTEGSASAAQSTSQNKPVDFVGEALGKNKPMEPDFGVLAPEEKQSYLEKYTNPQAIQLALNKINSNTPKYQSWMRVGTDQEIDAMNLRDPELAKKERDRYAKNAKLLQDVTMNIPKENLELERQRTSEDFSEFMYGFREGRKATQQSQDDAIFIANNSDDPAKNINYLEDEFIRALSRTQNNPELLTKEGLGNLIGGQFSAIIKAGAPAMLVSLFGTPFAGAAVGGTIGSADAAITGFGAALRQSYFELRAQGKTPEESYDGALNLAWYGAGGGAFEGALGAIPLFGNLAGKIVTKPITKELTRAGIDMSVDMLAAATSQVVQNKAAQKEGIERGTFDGVKENMLAEGLFSAGMNLGSGVVKTPGAIREYANNLSVDKQQKVFNELLKMQAETESQAGVTVSDDFVKESKANLETQINNDNKVEENTAKLEALNTNPMEVAVQERDALQSLVDRNKVPEDSKKEIESRLEYLNKVIADLEEKQSAKNKETISAEAEKEVKVKQGVEDIFESNPELANAVYEALGFNSINESEITYTDEEGNLCAKMGGRSSKFTKGSQWEIVKDLKGYPSHAQGGVDIKLGKNGFSFARGERHITAAHGLVLPNNFGNPIEFEAMSKVLSQRNKHLNWVDRGLNPDKYPKIDNQDGTFSTHRLAYSTGDNGEAYVYPTIIQNDKGELEQLDNNTAWEYAMKTKTAMVVPNVKLAEYYSQNGLIKH